MVNVGEYASPMDPNTHPLKGGSTLKSGTSVLPIGRDN